MNNWNTFKTDEAFSWKSELPPLLDVRHLLDLQRIVLEAGDRHEVLRVLDAKRWDYRRDRDGPVVSWLERHGDRIEQEDAYPAGLLLVRGQSFTAVSRLAYYDRSTIAEDWFVTVSELTVAAGVTPIGRPYSPLTVDMTPPFDEREEGFTLYVGTATDIWFPHNWTGNQSDPSDNRALSRLNAPRLNAFLAEVRNACRTLGGDWSWTRYPPGTWEVDDDGLVRLPA